MDLHKKAIPLRRGSLFDCRSSTKTAHETSTTCAGEWVQSTVYVGVGVVPPPGPPMSCAEGAAIGRNLRHVGGRACILRQNRQRDKYNVRG